MQIFITGGTGFIGREVSARLAARGHAVRVLARAGSEQKVSPGCQPVLGNALDDKTFLHAVQGCDTFVHLVGVPHPGPGKAEQFSTVDLASIRAAVAAAVAVGVQRFVYLSVARPAPVMKAYQTVRAEGEALVRAAGLNAVILRPWYVLGRGRRWPVVLLPLYWILERCPGTRDSARRLGLVSLRQITASLVDSIEDPRIGTRIIEVPEIRKAQAHGPRSRGADRSHPESVGR
ncbi:MAG TPA: NAD(P)H-binding protein [Bryobacteraceae bacterium]|nr:NAD(P)H-binding protein [Bryobacteraceae bacterium]